VGHRNDWDRIGRSSLPRLFSLPVKALDVVP